MIASFINRRMNTIINQEIWLVCDDEINIRSAIVHDMCWLVNKLSEIIAFDDFIEGNALLGFSVARPPLLAPTAKITSENYAVSLFITNIVKKSKRCINRTKSFHDMPCGR